MNYIGESAALGAAFLWSCSSFVFTHITTKISTLMLNVFRLIIASVLIAITILIYDINYYVTLPQFFSLAMSGVIGLILGDTFLFRSFKEIGPRVSMLLLSSNPALAALLAYFFLGETLSFWGVLGIIITLAGISIVVLDRGGSKQSKFTITKAGIFFGFMSAIGQAVGLLFAKYAFNLGDIHWAVATFIRTASSAVIMLPLMMLTGRFRHPFKPFVEDNKLIGWILLGSFFGSYIGLMLSFIAVRDTKVGISSTLLSTVPILVLPLSRFIHKEKLTWRAIAGAFIAVLGVAILFLR